MNPPVILLHGLYHTRLSMRKMARRLNKTGRKTHNIGYPSTRFPLEDLAEMVRHQIFIKAGHGPFDFVTHSMGGIVLRQIASTDPEMVHRAVMLAPPNQGAVLVNRFRHMAIARFVMGPAGQQLAMDIDSKPHQLGPLPFPAGIIAGTRPDNPLSHLFIPPPEDGRVSVRNTRIDGMAGHMTVAHGHFYIMQKDEVIQQTIHFLDHGEFQNNKK